MLHIHIPNQKKEFWDYKKNEFVYVETNEQTLSLEHSLVSLSKWEAKYHKPFLGEDNKDKTEDELLYYIKCMTISQNVKDDVYYFISTEPNILEQINKYIQDPATATTFYEIPKKEASRRKKETITSELIYYWMTACQIPFSCEKWNINRLLTLIRVCNVKNDTGKKMSKNEILAHNKALNEARKAKLNTRG